MVWSTLWNHEEASAWEHSKDQAYRSFSAQCGPAHRARAPAPDTRLSGAVGPQALAAALGQEWQWQDQASDLPGEEAHRAGPGRGLER